MSATTGALIRSDGLRAEPELIEGSALDEEWERKNELEQQQEAFFHQHLDRLEALAQLIDRNQKREKKRREKSPFRVIQASRWLFSIGQSLTNPLRMLPEEQLREKFIERLLQEYSEYDVESLKQEYLSHFADERALPERIREARPRRSRVISTLSWTFLFPYKIVQLVLRRRRRQLHRQVLRTELVGKARSLLTEISSSYGQDIYIEEGKEFELAELLLEYIEVGTFGQGDRTHLAQSIEYMLHPEHYSELLGVMELQYGYQQACEVRAYDILPHDALMDDFPEEARYFITMLLSGMMMDLSDDMLIFLLTKKLHDELPRGQAVSVDLLIRLRQYVRYSRSVIQKREYEDVLRDPTVIVLFFYHYLKEHGGGALANLEPASEEEQEVEKKRVDSLEVFHQDQMKKNAKKAQKKCLSTAITVFALKILSLVLLAVYDMVIHGSLYLFPLVVTVSFSIIVIYAIGLSKKVSDGENFRHLLLKRNQFFRVQNRETLEDHYEDVEEALRKKERGGRDSSVGGMVFALFRFFALIFSTFVTALWALALYFFADGLVWIADRLSQTWLEEIINGLKDPFFSFSVTLFNITLGLAFNFSLFMHDLVHVGLVLLLTGFAAGSALKIKRWRERKYLVEGFNWINLVIVITGLYPLTLIGNGLTRVLFYKPPWYLLAPMDVVVNQSARQGGWLIEGLGNLIEWFLSPFARLFEAIRAMFNGIVRAFLRMIGRKI